MNNKKLALVATALVATTALHADCIQGGFYVGANVSANFNNAKMKIDKEGLEAKAKAAVEEITGKINKAIEEANKLTPVMEAAKADLVKAIINVLKITPNDDLIDYLGNETHLGHTNGSLRAIMAGASEPIAASPWYKAMKLLSANDEKFNQRDETAPAFSFATINFEFMSDAINNTIQKGKIGEVVSLLIGSASLLSHAEPQGLNFSSTVTAGSQDALYKASDKTGAYVTFTNSQTAYNNAVATFNSIAQTYIKALETSKESAVLKAIYSDLEKKTHVTPDVLSKNLSDLGTAATAKELEELGINEKDRASKRATGFGIELVAGYDHRINDFMLGIDMILGFEVGGKVKIKDSKAEKGTSGVTIKKQYSLGLRPKITYLVTPECGLFVTVGGSINKYKVDTSHMMKLFDHVDVLNKLADAYNKRSTTVETDKINLKVYQQDQAKVFKSHSKTKFVPIFGGGISYAISPGVALVLEYECEPATKVLDMKKGGAEIKASAHKIKTGLRCRV